MKKNLYRKVLAVALALSIVGSPLSATPFAFRESPISGLQVSHRFGEITDSFASSTANSNSLVVLIQDLHGNAEVQRNIAQIIRRLVSKQGVNEVFSEGGIGRGDVSVFKGRSSQIIDQLVDDASLDGIELAAIQSNEWIRLQGLEDPLPYLQHVRAFRESSSLRPAALSELKTLRRLLTHGASPELKTQLFRIERLLALQLTRDDWLAYQKSKALNPQASPVLTSAIAKGEEFYRMAMVRDEVLSRNALALTPRNSISVVVTGGFHTQRLADRFRDAGQSYIVVTPNVKNLESDALYTHSLTDYLKAAQASNRQWRSSDASRLPADLRPLGGYLIHRVKRAIQKATQGGRASPVNLIKAPWYRRLPTRIATMASVLLGGYFLLRAGYIGSHSYSLAAAAVGIFGVTRYDDSGVNFDGEVYDRPLEPIKAVNGYVIERYQNVDGATAFVVKVGDKPRLAMRDNPEKGVYQSFPFAPATTQWEKEQYLEVLYNFLSIFRGLGDEKERMDIQTEDAVMQTVPEADRESTRDAAGAEKVKRGIVDRLDIFRYLAKARKTMAPLLPDYEVPHLHRALRTALIVDPKISNIEAVLIRSLLGNPDIDIPVVVGMSPIQLFVTMHSSVYRHFLPRHAFDYNETAGWVRIYNKFIRVVPNLNTMSSTEWQEFNIRTVVSTMNSGGDADSIAHHLHGGRGGKAPRIHLISLQPFFSGNAGDLYADGLSDENHISEKSESGNLQLVSSRLRVPGLFLKVFFDSFEGLKTHGKVSLTIRTPQRRDTQVLDKPSEVGGLTNAIREVPETVKAVRSWFYNFAESVLPPNGLTKPLITHEPTQVGTTVIVRLDFNANEMAKALGHPSAKSLTSEDVDLETTFQKAIEQQLFDNRKTLMVDREGPLFEISDSLREANSYARGKNSVIIDRKKMQVSLTGKGADRGVTIEIPLVFDDQYQDARHLQGVLYAIGKTETINDQPVSIAHDLHHSDWQYEVSLAGKRHTLPPIEPDLPDFIELAEKPLKIGIVSAGRTSTLFIRSLPKSLNLSLKAIQGPVPFAAAQAIRVDSTYGTFTSNGGEMKISPRIFESPRRGGQIGSIKINDDPSIAILGRALPINTEWATVGVDTVFDASGQFLDPTNPEDFFGHLQEPRSTLTGARFAFLSNQFKVKEQKGKTSSSAQPKGKADETLTVVAGLNGFLLHDYLRDRLSKAKGIMISGATCTTTCLSLGMHADGLLFSEEYLRRFLSQFGIDNPNARARNVITGATTVHANTNSQTLVDSFGTRKSADHVKMRSARGITPSPTGASSAIKKLRVLLAQAEKTRVKAVRVPVESGSYLPILSAWAIEELTTEEREKLHAANLVIDEKTKESTIQLALKKLQVGIFDSLANDPHLRGLVEHRLPDEATASATIVGSGAGVNFDSREIFVDIHPVGEAILVTKVFDAWYDNEFGYSSNQLRLMDQVARVRESVERELQKEHDFYLPSFMEVFRSIHNPLFGNVQWAVVLSMPMAILAYIGVLPRYLFLNAYKGAQGTSKWGRAREAFSSGHLFGRHFPDGTSLFTSGIEASPSDHNPAKRYLEKHEKERSEKAGLFSRAVLLGSHPLYSVFAILSAFPAWIVREAQHSVSLKQSPLKSLTEAA